MSPSPSIDAVICTRESLSINLTSPGIVTSKALPSSDGRKSGSPIKSPSVTVATTGSVTSGSETVGVGVTASGSVLGVGVTVGVTLGVTSKSTSLARASASRKRASPTGSSAIGLTSGAARRLRLGVVSVGSTVGADGATSAVGSVVGVRLARDLSRRSLRSVRSGVTSASVGVASAVAGVGVASVRLVLRAFSGSVFGVVPP